MEDYDLWNVQVLAESKGRLTAALECVELAIDCLQTYRGDMLRIQSTSDLVERRRAIRDDVKKIDEALAALFKKTE